MGDTNLRTAQTESIRPITGVNGPYLAEFGEHPPNTV